MNLDQVRARNAFASMPEGEKLRGTFLSLARSLPAMLQTNGLLATWAHLLAKKGEEHKAATAALLAHLRALGIAPAEGDAAAVLTAWWTVPESGASGRELRRLTAETIAFSVWLKRAAEALCDTGDSGGGGEDRAGAAPKREAGDVAETPPTQGEGAATP